MSNISKTQPELRFAGFTDAWEQRKLGDIIDKLTGGASIAPDDYVEEGYRTIPKGAVNDTGVADMSGCKCVSEAFFKKNISSKTSTGELVTSLRDLVPTAPNMGRIVRIYGDSEDFLMPQGVYSIVLKKDSDEDYLIAYSNSPDYRKIIATEKNGSTQVHIRNGEFLNIDIPVPTYDEQKRIGATIKDLDNLITLYQRKHDGLQLLKKSMLQKLFPKDGETKPEIRFAGFTDAWEQRKLPEFVTFYNGLTYTPDDVREQGILVLRSSNVKNGSVVDADNVYVDPDKAHSANVKDGDIIVVVRNGSRALIGKHAEIKGSMPNTVIGAFMTGIRSDYPSFVNALLDTPQFDKEIEKSMGATINQITGYMFSKMEFYIPSSQNEMKQIGALFRLLDDTITLHQRKLEQLKTIKQFLLQKMFV